MIKINEVIEVLKKKNVPDNTVRAVVEELRAVEEEKKAEKEPTAKSKKQYVVLAYDPENKLAGKDLFAFVAQIDEGESPDSILEKIESAKLSYNNSKKGRKYPARNLAEAFAKIPRKFSKEAHYLPKTKEVVQVIIAK